MKKFLLSLGILAGILSANATVYTVYEPGLSVFTGGNDGYTSTLTVDGKSFTLTSEKAGSTTNLISPNDNSYSWRIYKNSKISITSADFDMKGVRFTIDGSKYAVNVTPETGWTGELADLSYTFTNATGSKTFGITADGGQVRVSKIEVSDEAFSGGDTPEPSETVVKSIAELVKLETKTPVKIDFQTIVAFKNGNNVFIQDEAGDFVQIYGANSYENNDIIPAGWTATYELYSKVTPELTGATLPESTEKGNFVPKVVDANDITAALVNNVIVINDVEIEEATPGADVTDNNAKNFTGTSNGVELNLRNHYKLESVEPGTYNIEVLVNVYNNAVSLYVIDFKDTSAVNEIAVENGAAEYYTLQGVKVSAPQNGLYIVVKNGKASKVLVK